MATLSGSMRLMGRMRPSSLKFLCCLLLPASLSLADPGNILLLGGGNDAATSLEPIFPNSNNPHDFTVEGWIYPQRVPSIIFSDDAYSAEIVQNLFSTNSADLGIQFTITHESSDGMGMATAIYAFGNLRLYEWNHVAVMFGTISGMAVAINGEVFESAAKPSSFYSSGSGLFTIGTFLGGINEVRISNIRRYCDRYYDNPDCKTAPVSFLPFTNDPNTTALFRFDEATGATVFQDSSSNGHQLVASGNAKTAAPLEVLRPLIEKHLLTNGQYQFTASGPTGSIYSVQVSTNCINWNAVTNVVNSNFTFEVSVPIQAGSGAFFRLVAPSP